MSRRGLFHFALVAEEAELFVAGDHVMVDRTGGLLATQHELAEATLEAEYCLNGHLRPNIPTVIDLIDIRPKRVRGVSKYIVTCEFEQEGRAFFLVFHFEMYSRGLNSAGLHAFISKAEADAFITGTLLAGGCLMARERT